VANKYMRNVTFAYLGDPQKLQPRSVHGF